MFVVCLAYAMEERTAPATHRRNEADGAKADSGWSVAHPPPASWVFKVRPMGPRGGGPNFAMTSPPGLAGPGLKHGRPGPLLESA